jgi:glycosyltransferase involved in cell wall biosynthesis
VKRRPRVCIVRQQDVYELPVRREAEALVGAGYDVDILFMRHPSRGRTTVVDGVEITSLPASLNRSSSLSYVLGYLWFFVLVTGTLAVRQFRRRYAVVQVNTMPDFLVFAAIVPKLAGARVIVYMKEPVPELAETLYGPNKRLLAALRWLEQRALRFSDRALTVTEQLKQRYVERGADAARITVVLNGVGRETLVPDWSPPSDPHKEGFVVICHGTIEERYGQDTIIEAVALLRDELPDLRLVFTGRGSGVDAILRLTEERGLQDVVRFEGWVDLERLADLLYTADVGVVAQKASAYSDLVHTNKMMEYWILSLPVIASRLRATSETYDDSILEYYEPGDPVDLARAIRRLHDDPARREELVRNGAEAFERFGWDVQREVFLGVYADLLGNRR